MQIRFLGAAGEVTGSQYLCEGVVAGERRRFLVDCGLFQGGRDARDKNEQGFAFDPASLDGRVAFRPASPDRLPIVGAIPAVSAANRDTPLSDIPRQPALFAVSGFGARGLVWTSLMGELLASRINGDPLPLEIDLVDALDPARYLLKPPRPNAGNDD